MEIKDIISSGLLELYATGLASEEEAVQVVQWVSMYPEVADELEQIEISLELYSRAQSQSLQPSSNVKDRILAQIEGMGNVKSAPVFKSAADTAGKIVPLSTFWKYAAAASVILFLGSAVLNVVQYDRNRRMNKDLAIVNNELQQNKESVSALQQKETGMENYLDKVQSRYSTPVSLSGQPETPDAAAKVFWMKNTGDVYVDPRNLPQAPEGRQYELWAIVDGKPVNAGIIFTTKKGDRYYVQKMKSFGSAQAFAVSLEPANVKPAEVPTKVVSLGKM